MNFVLSKDEYFIQTFDLGGHDESPLREDLPTIILNKYTDDEGETNVKLKFDREKQMFLMRKFFQVNSEPYPFRSETALSTLIDGKSSLTHSSPSARRRSSRKLRKNFLRSRPAKKLRHPVKTMNAIETNHRSTSAPELFVTTLIKSNSAPLKTVRQWFKCSSVGRFVRTLTKSNIKSENQLPIESIPSTTQSKQRRRKYSDLIY